MAMPNSSTVILTAYTSTLLTTTSTTTATPAGIMTMNMIKDTFKDKAATVAADWISQGLCYACDVFIEKTTVACA